MVLAATALTGATTATNGTSFATASITPSANVTLIAFFHSSRGGTPTTPTASGNGLTWTNRSSVTIGDVRITLFSATGSSPSAGSITFSTGAETQNRAGWSVFEISGSDYATTDGIRTANIVTATGTGSILSMTLGAFANVNNGAIAGYGIKIAEAITADSGWTEIHDLQNATESLSIETQFIASNDTSASGDWATNADSSSIAAEILIATATNNDKFFSLF